MEVATEVGLPEIGTSLVTCIENETLLSLAKLNDEPKKIQLDLEKIVFYLKESGENWKSVREAIIEVQNKIFGNAKKLDPNEVNVNIAIPLILDFLKQPLLKNNFSWISRSDVQFQFIDLNELKELVLQSNSGIQKIALIDTRDYQEFRLQHIISSYNFCVEYNEGTLENCTWSPSIDGTIFTQGASSLEGIVLYDMDGTNLTQLRNCYCLMELLIPNIQISVLKGGLLNVKQQKPQLIYEMENVNTSAFILSHCEFCDFNFAPPIYRASKILPNIYIGDQDNANDLSLLEEEKITHVICFANNSKTTPDNTPFTCLSLPISEDFPSNINSYLEKALSFIDEGTKDGKVLVHCKAGVNRSATLVLAYLVTRMRYTLYEALVIVKQGRPSIRPMAQFVQLLIELDSQIHGKESVNFIGFISLLRFSYLQQNLIE